MCKDHDRELYHSADWKEADRQAARIWITEVVVCIFIACAAVAVVWAEL